MVAEPDDLRDPLDECDAEALAVVGAERQAVVGEAEAQADGRPPAMGAGDLGVVDVRQRRLDPHPPERRDEHRVVGAGTTDDSVNLYGNAVVSTEPAPNGIEFLVVEDVGSGNRDRDQGQVTVLSVPPLLAGSVTTRLIFNAAGPEHPLCVNKNEPR